MAQTGSVQLLKHTVFILQKINKNLIVKGFIEDRPPVITVEMGPTRSFVKVGKVDVWSHRDLFKINYNKCLLETLSIAWTL